MVKKVAILTAGGFAPCLSSAIGGLIERYTEVAPEVEIIAYRHGYQGLLKGDFLVVDDTVRANAGLLDKFGGSPIGNSRVKLTNAKDLVKRGLVAAGGGLLRLPHRIPYQKALELALTGDSFTAEQAAQWGFVNVLTEPGEALAGAVALAERISANGPLAVAVTKEIIVKSAGWSEDDMWSKQQDLVMPVFASKDAMEGATAFAEKRPPNWTGS